MLNQENKEWDGIERRKRSRDDFVKTVVCAIREEALIGGIDVEAHKEQHRFIEEWIEEIFNPYIEIKHPLYSCSQWQMVKTEYGFNSWFIPGNGGQIINVVPNLGLVIVINADNRKIPKGKRTPLEYLIKDLTKIHPNLKNE